MIILIWKPEFVSEGKIVQILSETLARFLTAEAKV